METEAARRAILELLGYDSGIRACAVLGEGGTVIAASADLAWAERVAAMFELASSDGAGSPVELTVAAPGGELIAVRDRAGLGRTAVALVDRHALGSLVATDLRAALLEIREAVG